MFTKKTILILLILVFTFFIFHFVKANGETSSTVNGCHVGWLISNPACACYGNCTLEDFLLLATNIAEKILQLSGVLTLLFFIIGGIIWISSGGSEQKVKKGKDIISGAIIGLVIILFAFMIVKIAMKALKTQEYLPKGKSAIGINEKIYCLREF